MKLAIFSMSLFLSFTSLAQAKTVAVQGDAARSIMEALYSAGFPVKHIDDDQYGTNPMTVNVSNLTCRYSAADGPDEWMSAVECYTQNDQTARQNSLALAKALAPFAAFEGAAGSRYLTANNIQCVLNYNERAYQCQLDVDDFE
ncbi:hypothetical protein DOM22_15255 [Bdellovibrio sp. ZAP7]|uniref:hypothetical protein n=1 Tax=Bdellovibrio sp. ZAP7 TaxID=2231053 RepID=UPI00115968A0|nr:hypothetical protein [Bdellovibrio sp. ZAP7]QDK46424.1 hypothetical protein DOM22_15255 [Bdellovibrio sp. ZAP7]